MRPIKYGRYYNYYTVADLRNISNSGWAVPTQAQWSTMRTYLGGELIAGGKLKMIGYETWLTPNTGASNTVDFNSKGSGYRQTSGSFAKINEYASYWSSTIVGSGAAQDLTLFHNNASALYAYLNWFAHGLNIRLIRPATSPELLLPDGLISAVYTGNDGKIYPCTKIGTQVYTAANLAETKFRNGDIIPFAGANGINFTNAEWAALTTAGTCAYNNDLSNI